MPQFGERGHCTRRLLKNRTLIGDPDGFVVVLAGPGGKT
jgi:hypothetical protein